MHVTVCICAYKLFFVIGMVLLNKNQKRLKGEQGGRSRRPPFLYGCGILRGGRGGAKQSPAVAPDPRHGIIPYMNMHAQVKNGAGAE